MIADDNIDILEAMQTILEDAGYEVIAVEDGQIVQDIKENLPDMIILDIWMSGMNGTDICRYLKSQTRTKNIPIILCSANRDTRKLAEGCEADSFLVKPFEMMDLLAKAEKYTSEVDSL